MQTQTRTSDSRFPESGQPSQIGKSKSIHPKVISLIIIVLLFIVGTGTFAVMQVTQKHAAYASSPAVPVTTFKNDISRTGQNTNEVTLNTTNVNQSQFGKRVEYQVDGQVYAQPLFMPNINIGGSIHNVVFVATQNDSLYAFDADQTGTTPLATFLWHRSFLNLPSVTSVTSSNVACTDVTPQYGITSTPVIDPSTNILYVVTNTMENGVNTYKLHAIDLTTGNDMLGSPTLIQASVQGTAGSVNFDSVHQLSRGGLLLLNGVVYIDWGSHCDNGQYHGWLMGYDAKTYQQVTVYNDTVNGGSGGIWQAADGIAADSNSNIYVGTGNGTFDVNKGGVDLGDSIIKLTTQGGLKEADYFTPFNQGCLNVEDNDLGSSGLVLLPTSNELVGSGKEGRIYVVNRDNLGQYTPDPTLNCNTTEENRTNLDKIVQEFPPSTLPGGFHSSPSYWNGSNGEFVYFAGNSDSVKAFQISNGLLSTSPTSQSPEKFNFPGGDPTISSNGNTAGTGIAWIIGPNGILYAYDATNLANELYNSNQNAARDKLPGYVKFTVPTIANGQVFVGTTNSLAIFGLLNSSPSPTPSPSVSPTPSPSVSPTPSPSVSPSPTPVGDSYNNVGITDDSNSAAGNFDGVGYSYSAQALQTAGLVPGQSFVYNNVTFTWPNVPSGVADNCQANGQTVPITPVSGATTLAFLGAADHGSSTGTVTITYTDKTTQLFPLGFSDWTLSAGTVMPSYNNSIAAMTSYRNSNAGNPNAVNTYVFYADVTLQTSKIVQSVTLPSVVSGGQLHIFSIGTKAGSSIPVYNNVGITDDSNTVAGNYDGTGHSYSAQALQAAGLVPGQWVTYNNVTFTWPNVPSGVVDNYSGKGQIIPVTPVSGATTLAFLGSATNGPSTGTATITYTDKTTQTFSLGFSDWTLNGGKSQPSYGNSIVAMMSYRNPHALRNTYVFYTDVTLQSGKTVQSVRLPSVYNSGHLHVFAIGTSRGIPGYNNVGITDDSSSTAGNFDGVGYSYSAQALQTAGLVSGQSFVYNNVTFTWPNVPSGVADNYQANGQNIPVTPISGATTLAFLGAADHGPVTGTATIIYADGTTQTFSLGFSDWTLNAGTASPSYSNSIAATDSYRNNSAGGPQTINTYIFYADVALTSGKTVKSVTLPIGSLHVFAIGTK